MALGQVNSGELQLRIEEPAGHGLKAFVQIVSLGNQFKTTLSTDEQGHADVPRLPYGIYRILVQQTGFDQAVRTVEVRSALPAVYTMRLEVKRVQTAVAVQGNATLVDPGQPSSVMRLGSTQIADRTASLPGRSLQDVVVSEPGWLYEGNAVLHPRGSEYQIQFVIDGIPLTDNRSPSFGPEIEADDINSISIYTAGIPAEYGRKMGGVVELNTKREPNGGVHGEAAISGGSYDTLQGYGRLQDTWRHNTLEATTEGAMTAHYLNPVVPESYSNRGTTGDFSLRYTREWGQRDRLSADVRHELARFEIPNEYVQQEAGQLQSGDTIETVGTATYQHIFSPDALGALAGMVRDNADDLDSNASSTPIIAFQRNDFREGYVKGTYSLDHGRQQWKAGIEADTTFLHENFLYAITDPTQFDPGTPGSLHFAEQRPDLEQSAFVEDLARLGAWTVSAGLRWDHYQLLLNQKAWSPRLSVGRSLPSLNMVLHASYDRVFQTPSFENILVSSSAAIDALSPEFLRLPVQPSRGNYYEGGLTEGFAERMRLDLNIYRRDVRNYADDDQLLNTGVSYPISFEKGVIYGAEGKLEVVRLGRLSGFTSYSYMVGNAWFPVTGGLFLGDDAAAATTQQNGHFPDSQDQRNTLETRFQYQAASRFWLAGGAGYGSGLPFAYQGDEATALAEYGPSVIDRVNFARGRVRPSLAVSASAGIDLWKRGDATTRLQVDGENLNNRLNVIDFGGLFSGNAIAPGRSVNLRLQANF
jgi:hypothetical protein